MEGDNVTFKGELESLINRYSIDAKAGTPDYILAEMVETYLRTEIFRHREIMRHKSTHEQETLIP